MNIEEVHERLRTLESVFSANGGRGVEVADEIDALRRLLDQRELAENVLDIIDDDEATDAQRLGRLEERASELAELVVALDDFRRNGGFDPTVTDSNNVQAIIAAARQLYPDDDRLVESGSPEETAGTVEFIASQLRTHPWIIH